LKLITVYDMGREEAPKLWEGRFFRHEGTISWRCDKCGEDGLGTFKLASPSENPKPSDYIDVLCLAETEHAVRCSGSPIFKSVHRTKYVEYSRADVSFDEIGTPQLFDAATRKYGDLTTYQPLEVTKK
jgi:hypothetical protein